MNILHLQANIQLLSAKGSETQGMTGRGRERRGKAPARKMQGFVNWLAFLRNVPQSFNWMLLAISPVFWKLTYTHFSEVHSKTIEVWVWVEYECYMFHSLSKKFVKFAFIEITQASLMWVALAFVIEQSEVSLTFAFILEALTLNKWRFILIKSAFELLFIMNFVIKIVPISIFVSVIA